MRKKILIVLSKSKFFFNIYVNIFRFLDVTLNNETFLKEFDYNKKSFKNTDDIIKKINNFIISNRKKLSYISKNQKETREKKKIISAHYVGYDPEEDI